MDDLIFFVVFQQNFHIFRSRFTFHFSLSSPLKLRDIKFFIVKIDFVS